MKILVTGGTGRIGANLVKSLLAKGHDIRSFVYPGDASRANKLDGYDRVETVVGDLRNFDDVKRAVEGVEAIYHLAAAFGGPFDNLQYLNINGMGTLNILECIRSELPNLHRLVYACTEAIYWRLGEAGRFFEEPITEEMVSRYHHMPYFLTKWIGEELCMTYHHQYGVPTTVVRFATVIEPSEFLNEDGLPQLFLFSPVYQRYKGQTSDDPEEGEMIKTIESLWTGEEKFLLSRNPNGRAYKQEFADVRDIVQGLVLGLEKDAAVGEEFTLGGAAVFDWEEAVPYLADRYNLDYVDARLPTSNYFEFDLSKIQNLLGYQPQHDLQSILDTAEAMRRGEDTGLIPTGVRFGGKA
ncbi:MAG: NAD(P)-dependent oxidoreductase [Candidatus Poribacteria bacterium]|nr:NAD(P)-dependent oxidoreductase [Candidatus Poribacteria bacterium]